MDYVFVRDREGYVCKKNRSDVLSDETVISEEEYLNESGLTEYEQKFGHGGKRVNAGRKNKYSEPLKFQIRVTEEEKEFIAYAREHHLDYASLMQE